MLWNIYVYLCYEIMLWKWIFLTFNTGLARHAIKTVWKIWKDSLLSQCKFCSCQQFTHPLGPSDPGAPTSPFSPLAPMKLKHYLITSLLSFWAQRPSMLTINSISSIPSWLAGWSSHHDRNCFIIFIVSRSWDLWDVSWHDEQKKKRSGKREREKEKGKIN